MFPQNRNNFTIISKVNLYYIMRRYYPGGMTIPKANILNPLIKGNNYQHLASTMTSIIPINTLKNHQYLARKYFNENTSSFPLIKVDRRAVAIITPLLSTQEINSSLGIKKPVNLIPRKMKSNSGKEFETTINNSTIEDDITDKDLIAELKKRELIKQDEGNTVVKIKLKDGSDYYLGNTKNKIKLSALGQAYASKVKPTPQLPIQDFDINKEPEFIIIVPPSEDYDSLFIETGQQKHLIVIYDSEKGDYYAIGYLTSKNSAEFLCDEQFAVFQKKQQKLSVSEKEEKKKQHYFEFDVPIKINLDDIMRVEGDTAFLENLSYDGKGLLSKGWEKMKTLHRHTSLDKNGLTKEDCLRMCQEHDKIVLNKGKHPLTADQIKLNEENEKKQKEWKENIIKYDPNFN